MPNASKKSTLSKYSNSTYISLRYTELPKSFRPRLTTSSSAPSTSTSSSSTVILHYFASHHCASCDALSQKPICDSCLSRPQETVTDLSRKAWLWERALCDARKKCRGCLGFPDADECVSLDCPVMYGKKTAQLDAGQIGCVEEILKGIKL